MNRIDDSCRRATFFVMSWMYRPNDTFVVHSCFNLPLGLSQRSAYNKTQVGITVGLLIGLKLMDYLEVDR